VTACNGRLSVRCVAGVRGSLFAPFYCTVLGSSIAASLSRRSCCYLNFFGRSSIPTAGRTRPHLSGPPDISHTFATPRWSLGPETVAALRLAFPRGPFDYYPGTDAWFEDLEVYRDGELMFGIITHEHEGVVRVRDEELARLDARGFRYRGAGQWVGY